MANKLLITDLDNTLYDWVTFFSTSFRSMVTELVELLQVGEDVLLNEFKVVHQRYGNSEQPFAALELPSLHRKFPELSREGLLEKIDSALHLFNSSRKRTLALYHGVASTLDELRCNGVKIVGHTEATVANSYWRLRFLKIEKYFNHLYSLESGGVIHEIATSRRVIPPAGFVTVVPRADRKPNPQLVLDICKKEDIPVESTFYVGDSLVRDVAMAKQAGATAIWARYGTKYDSDLWSYLVRVTHWTDDDVAREKSLRDRYGKVSPDFTIDSFSELKKIILDCGKEALRC
jgi:phosphoglycolate phosphatase